METVLRNPLKGLPYRTPQKGSTLEPVGLDSDDSGKSPHQRGLLRTTLSAAVARKEKRSSGPQGVQALQ